MVHRAHSSAVAAVWRSPMVDARRRRLVTSVGHVTRRRRRSSWGSCGTQFWYAHRPVVGDSAGLTLGEQPACSQKRVSRHHHGPCVDRPVWRPTGDYDVARGLSDASVHTNCLVRNKQTVGCSVHTYSQRDVINAVHTATGPTLYTTRRDQRFSHK